MTSTYTELGKRLDICASSLLENSLRQVVEISRGVGVVEALGEAVDEDAGIRARHSHSGVGAILVAQRQETGSLRVF